MKAVFVHSSRMVQAPNGEVYSRGSLAYTVWQRYLKHFDELTVVCRMVESSESTEGMNLSSGSGVTFAGMPDDHGNYLQQLMSSRNLPTIRRALADADALIVRSSGIGWLAAKEAELMGIPWSVEVVGDAWDALWNYGNIVGKLCAPSAWWQSRKWIKRAPFAIYVTRETLQKRYPCAGITSFASNVQISKVSERILQKRLHLHKTSESKQHTIKCGLIGSLSSRYKGLHIALRSMALLRKDGIDIHLHVLGAGNHQACMAEAKALGVADLLHLDGLISAGEEVFQWLDNLDFYIQPSLTEGLPRALIEAMSRGLPCLASKAGGIPELLPAECLHKPGDHRKLAADMQRMIEDTSWRLQLSERNFNEAKNYYSEVINERRDSFWHAFAQKVASQKKNH